MAGCCRNGWPSVPEYAVGAGVGFGFLKAHLDTRYIMSIRPRRLFGEGIGGGWPRDPTSHGSARPAKKIETVERPRVPSFQAEHQVAADGFAILERRRDSSLLAPCSTPHRV